MGRLGSWLGNGRRPVERSDPEAEKRRLAEQDMEAKRLEARYKSEIAVGYTAAGFPDAAKEMEEQVRHLRGEVRDLGERVRRLEREELLGSVSRGYGLDRLK